MVTTGIFVMYVMGAYVTWKTLAVFAASIPLLTGLAVYSLPDSPTSYMLRGESVRALIRAIDRGRWLGL